MMNDEAIHTWIDALFQSNQDVIEEFSGAQIKSYLQNQTYLMVFVCKHNLFSIEDKISLTIDQDWPNFDEFFSKHSDYLTPK